MTQDREALNRNPEPVEPVRVTFGPLYAHQVTFAEALDRIVERIQSRKGGYVVTPNVDQVCVAAESPDFASAHRGAFLSLVDGTPLVWLSRACRTPLPAKISGSDLIVPLCERVQAMGATVGLFGATDASSQRAQDALVRQFPSLKVVVRVTPLYDHAGIDPIAVEQTRAAVDEVRRTGPDILFVAMPTPKQELFLQRYEHQLAPTVMCGIGAGLDFIAGEKVRAPHWVQKSGLEWVFRLVQEPGRMWRRYLVRDRAIFGIALRQIRSSRSGGKGAA